MKSRRTVSPFRGGVDIDKSDYDFADQVDPKPTGSVPRPTSASTRGGDAILVIASGADPAYVAALFGALNR